ncbi:GIY-YIG nuclease family protein [candidate division KSB1 bacterium]
MSNKKHYVYILSNQNNKTLYIGVTNNLERRVYEHKNELINGFTKKYKLKKLVYYEEYDYINDAIKREKQLKNWHRDWKVNLIRSNNPEFCDFAQDWFETDPETSSG